MKLKSRSVISNFRLYLAIALILVLTSCSPRVSDNIHLKYGNPSQANQDLNNYLIERSAYALAYNCSAGIPNWVSWQLNRSWLGQVGRSDDFRPDLELPTDCYSVRPSDYRGSGYDRGHLAPSGDRTRSQSENSATFLMSNMIPQSPPNNREVWRELEEYSRKLALEGKELYIVAGGDGIVKKLANSKLTVPENTWKVILVLDSSDAQVSESNTYTIAVWMPNSEQVRLTDWQDYIVSVDEVEKRTGYNFFAAIPNRVEKKIEQSEFSVPVSVSNK